MRITALPTRRWSSHTEQGGSARVTLPACKPNRAIRNAARDRLSPLDSWRRRGPGLLAEAVGSGTIATMTRWIAPVLGVLLVVLGGLWTLQGLGLVGGSFMTGSRLWLVIGLVLVIAGVALLLRRRRRA